MTPPDFGVSDLAVAPVTFQGNYGRRMIFKLLIWSRPYAMLAVWAAKALKVCSCEQDP